MSKVPGNSEIGEVFQEEYEYELITWKIPNVSSIEISQDTEIRSPSFPYDKATWVLKIFPFREKTSSEKFYISVNLERLDSEIPVHNFFFNFFFKKHNLNVNDDHVYMLVKFDSKMKENYIGYYCNDDSWYDTFYHRRSYRWNDTIILVVKILAKKNTTIRLDSEANLTDATLGPKFDKSSNSLKEIGEIVKESFNVSSIAWKIPNVPYIPVEVDNGVQSPTISFAGVSWILKLFLCGQTKFKSEAVEVVIERLPCLIEKHTLSYEIFFKSYDENKPITKDYSTADINCFHARTASFIFDSDHVQENVLDVVSYKEFLKYATSSRQFGTTVLMCEFRMLKETEVRLSSRTESLQSFNEFLPLKTENIEKAEIGEIIKKPFECEVISWTIPSYSSLLTAESDAVSSPQFFYKGATWILEIYRPSYENDFTEVIMKRLNSQFPVHNFFCRSFFKVNGEQLFFKKYKSFISFDSKVKHGHHIWSYNIRNFYLYKECRCNDVLTLVCELYTEKNSVIEMDFKAKSFREASDNMNTERDPKLVGELSIESFDVEMIIWKISKARSLPTKVDYGVQSPSFPFAGASWILEMFPYGQKKFESERNVDLVIKRTFSLFPKHPVSYGMYFEADDKKFDEKGFSLNDFGTMFDYSTRGSFIFQSNNANENVCCVQSYGNFFNLVAPTRPSDTAVLVCDFRTKNNDGTKANIQRNLAKSSIGSSEQKFEKTAALLASSSKGSLRQKSEQTAALLASSSKESSEQKSEQKAASLVSSSNDSSAKKIQQSPGSYFAAFKGCDNVPRKFVHLPNKKLLQDLKDLFFKQEDCDVVLNVKGQQFAAHRLILKARSSVFASTFRNDMKEKATGVVDIEDCDPSSFSDFLYFLYCGSTEKLSTENVFSLFTTADKYDVQDLRSECLKFMRNHLSVDTFCDTIALALQHSERELIELATNFFSKNLQKIILTVKWQSFLVKNPIQGNELLIKVLASNE